MDPGNAYMCKTFQWGYENIYPEEIYSFSQTLKKIMTSPNLKSHIPEVGDEMTGVWSLNWCRK